MTEVKICGLMRREDILAAGEADHLGFVVATGTRRSLDLSRAKDLMSSAGRPTVAVTTATDPASIMRLVNELRPDAVQLSGLVGRESFLKVRSTVDCEVWSVVHVGRGIPPLDHELLSLADRVVLDTASHQGGGTGEEHDLDISASLVRELGPRTGLAGGLTPENVAAAVAKVRPYMVDVSSGVETDGAKDAGKIVRFIDEVRACR